MIGLIQLVSHAHVQVKGNIIGSIQNGILALIGIQKADTLVQAHALINKILNYRIFPDKAGKMNLSLKDTQGGLLLVPQFTLAADTSKGTRPGFSTSMPPSTSQPLFLELVNYAKKHFPNVATGEFGAYMQVELCNNGPITFILEVTPGHHELKKT